jgi:hypothetical protein
MDLVSIPLSPNLPVQRAIPTVPTIKFIGDTGSTHVLLRLSAAKAANVTVVYSHGAHAVRVPNGAIITSIGYADISVAADGPVVRAHVYDDDTLGESLLSIAALCNQGCTATFTANDVTIMRDGAVILHASKGPNALLWPITLTPSPPLCNSTTCVIPQQVSKPISPDHPSAQLAIHHAINADFVKFAHATLGSPTVSALRRAAKMGWLESFFNGRLTDEIIRKNPPNPTATAMGHLDLTRQGQKSTKAHIQWLPAPALPLSDDSQTTASGFDDDVYNPEEIQDIYMLLVPVKDICSADATGKFPFTSRRGHKYCLIFDWQNYVHSEPLESLSKVSYVNAYKRAYAFFSQFNIRFKIQRLDNQTSQLLEDFFKTKDVEPQYVPPSNHRTNKAERTIRDYKNHFISVLCTTDLDFPIVEWDLLMPQVDLTLNHLRPFKPRPTISAHEGLYGSKYDFNAHPLAPCGIRVVIFDPPDKRASWDKHGCHGFYLGPQLAGYRVFEVYSTSTKARRDADTLAWFPVAYMMPGSSPAEILLASIHDLTSILQLIASADSTLVRNRQPFDQCATSATAALRELAALFTLHPQHELPQTSVASPPSAIDTSSPVPAPMILGPAASVAPATEQRVMSNEPLPFTIAATSMPTPLPPLPAVLPSPDPYAKQYNSRQQRVRSSPSRGPITAPNVTLSKPINSTPSTPQPPSHTYGTRGNSHAANSATAESSLPNNGYFPPSPCPSPCIARPSRSRKAPTNRASRFLRSAEAGTAYHAAPAVDAPASLNITADGKPLNYQLAMAGPDAASWRLAEIDELIRLIRTSETMRPIMPNDQPADRRKDTAYYNPQTKEKIDADTLQKTFRIRGTIGGDRINYPGDVSARTADMEVVNVLLQSTISDRTSKWATADISDFYLNTILPRSEYLRIPLKYLPAEIIDMFHLTPFIHNGYVLFEVLKGMYGLPQAGILAQNDLVCHLKEHGYIQSEFVPCLFRHITRNISFTLVVDDFGVKYQLKDDADHLFSTLRLKYKLKVDWEGRQYLGRRIVFDYSELTVTIDMPDYIPKVIKRFRPNLKLGAGSPGIYTPPSYGSQTQHTTVDDSPPP